MRGIDFFFMQCPLCKKRSMYLKWMRYSISIEYYSQRGIFDGNISCMVE
jgi:hypothetical protein